MDLDEAALILKGPRGAAWAQALECVRRFLQTEARHRRATADEADEIAQNVVIKLWTRLQSGEVPWADGCHRPYLKSCAENGVATLRRQSSKRTTARLEELPAPATDDIADAGSELVEAALAVLPRVAQAARERRAARYRADFDETWRQLQALALQGASLRSLLEAEGKLGSEADEASFVKARNNAYKAHERVRGELLQALEQLSERGELTVTDAELVRRALRVFVRCQRRATPRVSPRKGPPP